MVRNKDSHRAGFRGWPSGLKLEARPFILCGFDSDVTPIIQDVAGLVVQALVNWGLLYLDGRVEHTYVRNQSYKLQ
jgi:hypothetical protein